MEHKVLNWGTEYGPLMIPSAINLYAASVKWIPSHPTYLEGSSQAITPGLPQGSDLL
jgi:hypothetical protein